MGRLNRLRWTKIREGDGAAMIEFAIGITVLSMLVLGIIEFGFSIAVNYNNFLSLFSKFACK